MTPASEDESLLLRFDNSTSRRAVVLEDDGRVAYAYLLEEGKIVGDVWLYNVGPSPDEVDWGRRDAMPFENPRSLGTDRGTLRLSADSAVNCQWSQEGDVTVFLDGVALARLAPGSTPGWSRLAIKDGPLARPLTDS